MFSFFHKEKQKVQKFFFFSFSIFLFISFPLFTFGKVYISEVAWMGTSEGGATDEWIELYNDGNEEVFFEGWSLVWGKDKERSALLPFSIGSKEYALLYRKEGGWKGSGLNNSGHKITLFTAEGEEEDSVGKEGEEWAGGNNTTKETLQRNGSPPKGEWITASPTPKYGVFVEEENISTHTQEGSTITTSSSSTQIKKINIILPQEKKEKKYKVSISCDEDFFIVGVPQKCTARLEDSDGEIYKRNAHYSWNFGDGVENFGKNISHTYSYGGEYVLFVLVKRKDEKDLFFEEVVKVESSVIKISSLTDSYIEVENKRNKKIDISGFILLSESDYFVFPPHTYIPGGKKAYFSHKITGIDGGTSFVHLIHKKGIILSTYEKETPFSPTLPSLPLKKSVASLSQAPLSLAVSLKKEEGETEIKNKNESKSNNLFDANYENSFEEKGSSSSGKEKNDFLIWTLLGLFSLTALVFFIIHTIRKEEEEIISGFVVEEEKEE